MAGGTAEWVFGVAARELALFAAIGFLIGGINDLVIDLIWLIRSAWRACTVYRRHPRADAASLAPPMKPGRIAIFVPAWREEAVIGAMIETALASIRHPDWRLYVGCYPNDPGTIAAVRVAGADPRVRLVIGDTDGPTTKAGCLNWLWRALMEDEAAEGVRFKAVVLHDAEDVIHPDELAVHDSLIERFDLVQLPVLPVVVRGYGAWGALVSGHYCGEFAEAHAKQVVVREALGAAVPSAGVGCAIARDMLGRLAGPAGTPFDPDSLTEDYELGLHIGMAGGRGAFVRVRAAEGKDVVAVRSCFPHGFGASVLQKARWVTGIALAGWDRLGWGGGLAECWMRFHDRRSLIAALVLVAGYGAIAAWVVAAALSAMTGRETMGIALPGWLIVANLAMLLWRVGMRCGFTLRGYGRRMAMLTPLHMLIGNLVAIGAAMRAFRLYLDLLRHGRLRWDKTAHVFPSLSCEALE
ncbi:MAG TPA: glycosyl transferase family protein [Sphingomonas sp.]|nr:glycosyl transferase family protein [Sphingomonas sp.]